MAKSQKARIRAKDWIQIAEGFAGAGIGFLIAISIGHVLVKLQAKICEVDAFLSGPTRIGEFLVGIVIILGLIVATPVSLYLVFRADMLARQILGIPVSLVLQHSRQRHPANRRWAIWAIVSFSVTLMLGSLAALESYFCAAASGITLRQAIWTELKDYRWDDVRDVITKCDRLGRSQRNSYVLVMMDGNRIDLAIKNGEFAAAYPQVEQALHGLNVSFRTISPEHCPPDLKAIFTKQP